MRQLIEASPLSPFSVPTHKLVTQQEFEAAPIVAQEVRKWSTEVIDLYVNTVVNTNDENAIPLAPQVLENLPELKDAIELWSSEAATNASIHGSKSRKSDLIIVRFGLVTQPTRWKGSILIGVGDTEASLGKYSNDEEHNRGTMVMNLVALTGVTKGKNIRESMSTSKIKPEKVVFGVFGLPNMNKAQILPSEKPVESLALK